MPDSVLTMLRHISEINVIISRFWQFNDYSCQSIPKVGDATIGTTKGYKNHEHIHMKISMQV